MRHAIEKNQLSPEATKFFSDRDESLQERRHNEMEDTNAQLYRLIFILRALCHIGPNTLKLIVELHGSASDCVCLVVVMFLEALKEEIFLSPTQRAYKVLVYVAFRDPCPRDLREDRESEMAQPLSYRRLSVREPAETFYPLMDNAYRQAKSGRKAAPSLSLGPSLALVARSYIESLILTRSHFNASHCIIQRAR